MTFLKRIYRVELLFALVLILGFLIRFYSLSDIPKGLYPDETAIGYNAFSILTAGIDEHGQSYPLYFRSFDDYKLPLYIYSTSVAMMFFGVDAFSVRFTSAFFGVVSVGVLFLLIYLLTKNKLLSFLISFFLAVNPWHTLFSRAGYEVNVATSLILIGVLFFMTALKRNSYILFCLSAVSFALSVYTYNVTRLIAPIVFILLIAFFYKTVIKKSKKQIVISLSVFAACMLPFLVTFVTLQSESGFSSHKDALIIGNAMKAELVETRSYFISLPQILQKFVFNYWFLVGWTYLRNLVSFFSTSFYFIAGSDHPNQNIHDMAMFYYFEFPFIIYGLYYGLKKKVTFLTPFLIWLAVIFIFGSIIKSVPNGTRTFPVVIPLTVLSGYGFYLFITNLWHLKKGYLKYPAIALTVLLLVYSYLFYFLSYSIRYPIEHAKDWRSEDQRTVNYILSVEHNYKKIIFEQSSEFFYTSLLFYGKYPPLEFKKEAKYKSSGLTTTLERAGKYEFRKIDWELEDPKKETLYITSKNYLTEYIKILEEINYPTRPSAVYYDRKIGQHLVTDNAYVIFEAL